MAGWIQILHAVVNRPPNCPTLASHPSGYRTFSRRRPRIQLVFAALLLVAASQQPRAENRGDSAGTSFRASAVAALEYGRRARFGPAESFLGWWNSASPVQNVPEKGAGQPLTVWSAGSTRNFKIWPEGELVIDLQQHVLRRGPALDAALAPLVPAPDPAAISLPADDRVIARRHARLSSAFDPGAYRDNAVLVVLGKVTGALPGTVPGPDASTRRLLFRVRSSFGRTELTDLFIVLRWPVTPRTEIRLPRSGEEIVVALNSAIPAAAGDNLVEGVRLPEWDLAISPPIGVIGVVNGKTFAFHEPGTPPGSLPEADRIRIRWSPSVPVYGQDAAVLMKFLSWAVRQDPFRFPRPPIPIEIARELTMSVPGT